MFLSQKLFPEVNILIPFADTGCRYIKISLLIYSSAQAVLEKWCPDRGKIVEDMNALLSGMEYP